MPTSFYALLQLLTELPSSKRQFLPPDPRSARIKALHFQTFAARARDYQADDLVAVFHHLDGRAVGLGRHMLDHAGQANRKRGLGSHERRCTSLFAALEKGCHDSGGLKLRAGIGVSGTLVALDLSCADWERWSSRDCLESERLSVIRWLASESGRSPGTGRVSA